MAAAMLASQDKRPQLSCKLLRREKKAPYDTSRSLTNVFDTVRELEVGKGWNVVRASSPAAAAGASGFGLDLD